MLKCVEFHPTETLASFLSRTAAVNGAGDMRALLKHLGTTFTMLSGDRGVAGNDLSTQLGISVERLNWAKLRRINKKLVSVNGHEFKAGSFRRGPHHYCPLCLMNDMSSNTGSSIERPFARLSWAVTMVHACPFHGVRLAVAEDFGRASDDFVRCVSSRWAAVEFEASRLEAVELEPADRYFAERLNGSSSEVPLLDELPFHWALDLCENLGCQLEHGSKTVNMLKQRPETRSRFRSAGFHLIALGEEALRTHLADAAKRYWSTAAWHPLSSLFGNFHLLLSRHVDVYPRLARLLREIVQEHLPVGPEDILLGAPCERRVHTVLTIARRYEIPHSTVRAMLRQAGLLDDDARFKGDAQIAFDKDVLRTELEHEAHLLSYDNLLRRMGMAELTGTCVFDPSWEHALRRRSTFDRGNLYSLSEAAALYERMTASSTDCEGAGLVGIADAARLSLSSMNEVIQLLVDGKLQQVGRFGRRFSGITVSYLEVREAIATPHDASVLHDEDLAVELDIPVVLAKTLMKARALPVETIDLPGYSKCYPVARRHAIDEFRAEHVSIGECARKFGMHRDDLISRFHHAKLLPSIKTERGVPAFYLREDVERVFESYPNNLDAA